MRRITLICLLALGCSSDPDSGPVQDALEVAEQGDVVGTDAPGDDTTPDPDVADPIPQPPTTGPRAYVIQAEHTDDLAEGDMASARIGDIVLMNDDIRFVIRTGPQAMYLAGLGGGAIVDAGTPETDRLQELTPIAALHSMSPESLVTIEDDGHSGEARVVVTSPAVVPAVINGWIQGLQEEAMTISVTYRLGMGRALEIITAADKEGGIVFGDVFMVGGEIDITLDENNNWLLAEGPEVSYAMVSEGEMKPSDLGGISLLFGPTLEGPAEWSRWFIVGDGSLSSVLDEVLELRMTEYGTVSGVVDGMEPGVQITAYSATGAVVSRFRPDEAGSFSGRLPVGLFTLVAEGEGRAPGAAVEADVMDGAMATVSLSADKASWLEITTPEAIRLTIKGQIVPVRPGTSQVALAPGEYTITASRGFEYEADETTVTLEAGSGETWSPVVERVVDTTGWIAMDSHLHSEWSPDSRTPLRDKVVACAAEGIEYAVATDHDVVTDYAPYVLDSLKDKIVVGVGVEVSTARLGHINVWPITMDKDLTGRGSPLWHDKDFPELMDFLVQPGRIVQLNHARGSAPGSTLDQIKFKPNSPDPELLETMTFNALELDNAGGKEFDQLFADWRALIDLGKNVAATGVSDSHSIGALCGHARTYVKVANDDPATVTSEDINAAILAGHTMVSAGPFLTVEPGAPGTVRVKVAGPSWMPIETIQMYEDGLATTVIEVPEYSGDTVRFDADVPLAGSTATWVTAAATASKVPGPMLKRPVRAVAKRLMLTQP